MECGWYDLDPETGACGEYVNSAKDVDSSKHYWNEGDDEAFSDALWGLHALLMPHARPPYNDIMACVKDGAVANSFKSLQIDTDRLAIELKKVESRWHHTTELYQADIGRPPRDIEKRWIVHPNVQKMSIGHWAFYKHKRVTSEEWMADDIEGYWGRVRVFDDLTADAWTAQSGLGGFEDESAARTYLGEMHIVSMETLRSMGREPSVRPQKGTADEDTRFRYFGEW